MNLILRIMLWSVPPLIVILGLAFAFADVKPEPYGGLLFKSALAFGSISAIAGFAAGYMARAKQK